MNSDTNRPKRPRDLNQLRKLIVDLSVGEAEGSPALDHDLASRSGRARCA
jgi:hypothetical protein